MATRRPVHRVWVVVTSVLLCLVPVAVALSRVYRGMHYPTDVVAGALAGGLWMAIVVATLLRPHPSPPAVAARSRGRLVGAPLRHGDQG
jgi:membrane-associated phospholipid phosphatase